MLATAARFSEGTPRQTQSWLRDLEKSPILCYTERSSPAPASPHAKPSSPRSGTLRRPRTGTAWLQGAAGLPAAAAQIPIEPESRRNAGEFTSQWYERTRRSAQRGSPQSADAPLSRKCLPCRVPHAESLALKIPIEPKSRRKAGEFTLRRYEGRARQAAQQGLTSAGGGRAWRRP